MRKKRLKGSMTIETAVIVSVIAFVFMGFCMTLFYYHDKNIIYGAAYETAVAGSMEIRRKEPVTEEELTAFCRDRLKKKCIFMTSQEIEVVMNKEEIIVRILAAKRGYRLMSEQKAPVTNPEKKIRDVRRMGI